MTFEPINRDALQNEKVFVKLLKKQQKEMETVKKRFQKERTAMQKQHCVVVDKVVMGHDKEKVATEKSLEKMLKKKGYNFASIL